MMSSEEVKIAVLLVLFIAPFVIVIRKLLETCDDAQQRDAQKEAATASFKKD